MQKDSIDIKAFDSQGTLLFHQIYSTEEWYENSLPIIDSNDFRLRYKVARVEGRKFDTLGIEEKWKSIYSNDGALIEARTIDSNGTTTLLVRQKDGSMKSVP